MKKVKGELIIMSLCIAMNNPGQFVVIAADGRIMRDTTIVNDNHQKLTMLPNNVSMFSSGAQDYCEELRSRVVSQVRLNTTIKELAHIVQKESVELFQHFEEENPHYFENDPNFCPLATILAFYDLERQESGFIEYCHSSHFTPHITTASKLTTRGVMQEGALEYLKEAFNGTDAIESVLNTFTYANGHDDRVGGSINVHVIHMNGTTQYTDVVTL